MQNMIAQSQSGTGKTAAFVLAMLSRVDPSKPYPQVPTLFQLQTTTSTFDMSSLKYVPVIRLLKIVS
jgi:ATP-dependent RNA helicase DDX19/DBP5